VSASYLAVERVSESQMFPVDGGRARAPRGFSWRVWRRACPWSVCPLPACGDGVRETEGEDRALALCSEPWRLREVVARRGVEVGAHGVARQVAVTRKVRVRPI
jgi:hypothetical protein